MTKWTIPDDLVKRLRGPVAVAAQDLIDRYFGNSDKCLASIPANPDRDADLVLVDGIKRAADRIEALEAENARLRAAHLTIIQSVPTLQYAIQTSRDALYPKEGGE